MLELINIRKSLGGQEVLRGVNLKVGPAEKVVVIGRSGCGKSVMLKHIMGLLKPDAGQVIFEGTQLTGLGEEAWNPYRRKIGMLFQGAALFDSLSVFENLAFPLREEGEKNEKALREKSGRGPENRFPGGDGGKDAGGAQRGDEKEGRPGPRDHSQARSDDVRRTDHGTRSDRG